jgi:3-oxoacyl-[acyl-carrier protein] reductase
MKKLDRKVALITGSGRGIGRAVAMKLASEGALVVVNDMDESPAREVVTEIQNTGGKAVACVGSVIADGFAERFIQTALDNFAGIDIIVNNAGYTLDNLIYKSTDDQFDAMYKVHLKAPYQILRAASPYIVGEARKEAAEGQEVFRKVVNISSVVGLTGNIGQVNYSSMKAGLVGLTKTLSKEWGLYKVNVNCVAFGLIETRLTQAVEEKVVIKVDNGIEAGIGMPSKVVEGFKSMVPFGRAGTVEEAAGGVYLFCIPESNYINGQVISIAGGL